MKKEKRAPVYAGINGSITVEAVFVFPIVLFIIFSLLCLSFYLHDKCRLQSIADKVLHKASLTMKHEADITTGKVAYEEINARGVFYLAAGDTIDEEESIKDYLKQELSNGLFYTRIKDIRVEAGKQKIELTVEGDFIIPIRGILDYFNPGTIMIHATSPVHNPAETIRVTEVILDTGEKVKGISELKDKIERFFN